MLEQVSLGWLDSPLGRRLLECERRAVGSALDQVFGEELLQLGCWGPRLAFLQYARTRHASLIGMSRDDPADLVAHPHELPIASDSVDAVLLPHTLEWTDAPHALLREVDRVLRPDGKVLILGFNRYGPFGLRRLLTMRRSPPGVRQLFSEHRLRDWLKLLDYSAGPARCFFFVLPMHRLPPSERHAAIDRFSARWLPALCGGYLLVGEKRLMPMTRVRNRRRPRLRAVGGALVEPSTRNST